MCIAAVIRKRLEVSDLLDMEACNPDGGGVAFPRVGGGIDAGALADRLLRTYRTLVVPGLFFESPRHIRVSFGCRPAVLERGLANISRALDDLSAG